MQSAERQLRSSVRQEGVITCFLSLILLILVSLVSVTLESARVAGARFLVESYTRMAEDSVMAGYSGALFDRYHIFAYNTGAKTPLEVRESLKMQMEYYINRNLQADNKMLWLPVLQETGIRSYELLTDREGEVFREAASEYMKYRGTSMLVENLLSSLGVFQGAQETMALMEVKAETEEALAQIDGCILDLFESVDGFVRDDTGIRQNIWGKVKIKKYFVKKLHSGELTQESVQINHSGLWDAVQECYLDPQDKFELMTGYLDEYDAAQEQLVQIATRLEELDTEGFFENPAAEVERALLEAEQLFYIGKLQLAWQRYRSELRTWKSAVNGCKTATENALETLGEIRDKQASALGKVLQYEEQLLAAAKWLDPSLYKDLTKGLATMKRYVDLETEGAECIVDVNRMEESLMINKSVLSHVAELIGEEAEEDSRSVGSARTLVAEMASWMMGYTHGGLCFDYSEIHLEAEGESPMEDFRSLLLGGIAELVLEDVGEVSQSVLSAAGLPSVMEAASVPSVGGGSSGTLMWMDAQTTGMSSVLGFVNDNSPFAGVVNWIGKEGEALLERVLFLSYLSEHFANYETQNEAERVLAYEQEYLLCGGRRDALNLYEVMGRILLVRIVFNLIHVLSDAEKCGIARETAMGLLGVTGLPVLVSIMKFMILFVWAAEGALVETAAILQGKKLAAIPTKEGFPVQFSELLLMSKAKIQEKAERISEKEGFAFGYSEYLMLFLLLQDVKVQGLRALDLIQENLALEETGFRISQMVSSFLAWAEYFLPELFTGLPFSKRKTGGYVL